MQQNRICVCCSQCRLFYEGRSNYLVSMFLVLSRLSVISTVIYRENKGRCRYGAQQSDNLRSTLHASYWRSCSTSNLYPVDTFFRTLFMLWELRWKNWTPHKKVVIRKLLYIEKLQPKWVWKKKQKMKYGRATCCASQFMYICHELIASIGADCTPFFVVVVVVYSVYSSCIVVYAAECTFSALA